MVSPPNDESSIYHHQRSKDSSDDLWFSFQPNQIHIFYELGIGRIFRDPNSLPGQKHESGSLIGWSVSSKFLFSLKEPLKTDSRCGYSHGGLLILLIRIKIRDFTFLSRVLRNAFLAPFWIMSAPDLTSRAWWSLIFWRRAWIYVNM